MSQASGSLSLKLFTARLHLAAARERLARSRWGQWRHAVRPPSRLLLAPTDLGTADPTLAKDMENGHISWPQSSHRLAPTSYEQNWFWRFEWLRHLRTLERSKAQRIAHQFAGCWLKEKSKAPQQAWSLLNTSERLIACLSHSPLLLGDTDNQTYRALMRMMAQDVQHLSLTLYQSEGWPRLQAALAITMAGLSFEGNTRLLRKSQKWLSHELNQQILRDGGHISRNPETTLKMLALALPLRQAFSAREMKAPEALTSAISRAFSFMRLIRHNDGGLALFHGSGSRSASLLSTVLAYDDARTPPATSAPYAGYERISAGTTTVLIECGVTPALPLSQKAHAACAAFEMSDHLERVITSLGTPHLPRDDQSYRHGQSHATACVGGQSCCDFIEIEHPLEGKVTFAYNGVERVQTEREENSDSTVFKLNHDGFRNTYNLIHHRTLSLSNDGLTLTGDDMFVRGRTSESETSFTLYFPLHPGVRVVNTDDEKRLELHTPRGSKWILSADVPLQLHKDRFAAALTSRVETTVIIAHGRVQNQANLNWQLKKAELENDE